MADSASGTPVIKAMKWLPARNVLAHEAADFTPWLAENLELLADALGLAELALVETESAVAEKRLDILATATEHDGDEYPVVIENQYGITDHKHLGQIITYLAQQGRGLAVWMVESYSEAHSAAVEFLNRTSSDDVGYVLARVRFTQGGSGEFQVDFEILARPNSFLRRAGSLGKSSSGKPVNQAKKDYLEKILEYVKAPLAAAGMKSIRMHTRGAYIEMRFPPKNELDNWSTRLKIRVTRDRCSVGLHIAGFDSREENSAALDVLQERLAAALTKQLPSGTGIDWHSGAEGAESDFAGTVLKGAGYVGGDSTEAAQWAEAVCSAWIDAVLADPPVDLEALVQERLADAVAEPDVDLT